MSEPATFNVEVMSEMGAERLLSLRGLTSPPAVGDTITIGDRWYQVLRRHWVVGAPAGRGGFPDEYATSIGEVELYVRRVTFTGPYGRKVGRPKATAAPLNTP